MKKNLFAVALAFVLLMSACGGSKDNGNNGSSKSVSSETNSLQEVQDFANTFAEMLAADELESVLSAYPELADAQDLASVEDGNITVKASGVPGEYDVTLTDGVTMKVALSDDGQITVKESKGLFTYPEDKVEIAKKTGLWDDSLNDVQLNERMSDEGFFKWVKNAKEVNPNKLISIGEFEDNVKDEERGTAVYDGYQYLKNNTDVEINGNDYKMIYKGMYWDGSGEERWTKTKPGKTIPPRGKVKVQASGGYHGGETVEQIKMTLSPEQLQEKYGSYTGKEYQEYRELQQSKR